MQTQDAEQDGVESAHPQAPGAVADERCDALFHLAGGLVGERQGHDAVCLHSQLQQVGYLVRQDARLAGAGAGYHQLGPGAVFHGGALRVVESGKN